jgi:hypothetical protein
LGLRAASQPFSLADAGIFISILMTFGLRAASQPFGLPHPSGVGYVHWLGVCSLAWSPFTDIDFLYNTSISW